MADTTEKKTYLVNIESNLKKYSEDAAAAKKEVDALTASTTALKKEGKDNTAEYQIQSAQLKVAKQNYTDLQKVVAAGVQLTNKELSYRQQLTASIKISIQAIKDLGKGYAINADGHKIVNPLLIKEQQNLANLNKELIRYDRSLNSGKTNVGRYAEALKEMGGSMGSAVGMGERFASTFAKIGPIGALIGGGLLAISAPLIAFFTKSEKGIELLERKVAGFKAAISVLTGELIESGDRMVNALDAPEKKTKSFWTWVGTMMGPAWISTGIAMDTAAKAAENYTKVMQELDDEERSMIVPRAEANKKIKEARLLFADETKTIDERINALQYALDLENKTADAEIEHQKKITLAIQANNKEKEKTLTIRDSDLKALEEAKAKEIDLLTESMGRQIRVAKTITAERNRLLKEEEDAIKEKLDKQQKAVIEAQKLLQKEVDDYKKAVEAKRLADQKWNDEVEQVRQDFRDRQLEAELTNQENLLATREANNEWIYDTDRARLQAEYEQEIANAEKIGSSIALIEDKYAAIRGQIDRGEADAKLGLYADFAGNLSTIFGKNTAIGKAAAIAEATINTYRSAAAAYAALAGVPVVGPALAVAAAAAAVAAGLANVKRILAVKVPGGDAGGPLPSAISSSAPAQRTFAQPVGSSVLTQPQLSQPQLNALPGNTMLTAADIAAAFSKMPPPVVTVEDINAKTKSVNKVAVRANI